MLYVLLLPPFADEKTEAGRVSVLNLDWLVFFFSYSCDCLGVPGAQNVSCSIRSTDLSLTVLESLRSSRHPCEVALVSST